MTASLHDEFRARVRSWFNEHPVWNENRMAKACAVSRQHFNVCMKGERVFSQQLMDRILSAMDEYDFTQRDDAV